MVNLRLCKIVTAGLLFLLVSSASDSEVINGGEFEKNKSGYPCLLSLQTNEGPKISIQLSDYEGIWSLHFFVSGYPRTFAEFFDSDGIFDSNAFENRFTEIRIGAKTLAINDSRLWEIHKSKLDGDSDASFDVIERHNVAAAIDALRQDGLAIPGLISATNLPAFTSEFRICSLDSLGLGEGERVEVDFRADYRMIFEKSFENWVVNLLTADSCLQANYDDNEVDAIISDAASAFYPGIFNMLTRGDYREKLERKLPLYRLSGSVEALKGNCLLSGDFADLSKRAVERTIEAANDLE